MRTNKPPKDPLQFAEARHDAAREVVEALTRSLPRAMRQDRHELKALASRINHCNSTDNTWFAEGAVNEATNEKYVASGRFWRCGSKLCPDCIARQARRTRQKLKYAVQSQALKKGERYYFVTFTIPNPGLSLLKTRYLVDRAWTLFRKRLLCVSLIRGGSKSEEFTVTKNGYHYHLHCLFLSKYITWQELRRSWTECVETVFNEEQLPFETKTNDGLLWTKIIKVTPNAGLYHELCKYVTKADSWSKVPASDLVEIALVRKWNRMFEVFGSFRGLERPANPNAKRPIVHTRFLNDASEAAHSKTWRDDVREMNIDVYEMVLWGQFEKAKERRRKQLVERWRWATITTLYYHREMGTRTLLPPKEPVKPGENST